MVKKRFKFFIGYRDAKKIRPLCIFLPNMTAYRKDFDETKYMSFLIKNDELLVKYNEIWEIFKNNSEPVYNEKYLKAEKNTTTKKSIQISATVKYQKKIRNTFTYQ